MKPPKIKQSENDVKKAIRDYLELNGWTVFRINNAGTKRKDKKGREFYTFNGTPGVLDMYCLKTGEYPMWIETKATGKIPSGDQMDFIRLVNSASYGRAFWADSFGMFLANYNHLQL